MATKRTPWPGWVYRDGQDPPYQSSLGNERTFLSWVRTALSFLAAGIALDVVDLSIPRVTQTAVAVGLVTLGLLCAVVSWVRWGATERAMRLNRSIPSLGFGMVFMLAIGGIAALMVVAWL
ncbi:YidH family protein [Nocardioides jishulii]|uniref:DUF202 domain-containing protein n=1 Tax=Nocardioides jishulii TaxID=2575440 RepID=A0A4U2YQG0_9ACTN|nr:DUF202 domain-containing protein [Nocardioides jishulii]QCX26537.1 DUF202 domain-containing protein [Nocardioides jishulii]TKI63656.1 DUF202 domain-containing protein [Nocardioides jishulii]